MVRGKKAFANSVDPDQFASEDLDPNCLPLCEFISNIGIKQSDWLKLRNLNLNLFSRTRGKKSIDDVRVIKIFKCYKPCLDLRPTDSTVII